MHVFMEECNLLVSEESGHELVQIISAPWEEPLKLRLMLKYNANCIISFVNLHNVVLYIVVDRSEEFALAATL